MKASFGIASESSMEVNHEINLEHDLRSDSVESHLSAMDSPTHPWYLSTKAMFRVVNKATMHLSVNHVKFEQSLYGITELTKFIDEKTARGALYINLEKAQSLIDKLDAIRSDQFVVLNDGHDHQRTELSTALRNLEASIAEQKNLAESYLSAKAQESQDLDGTGLKMGLRDTVSSLRAALTAFTNSNPVGQPVPGGEAVAGVHHGKFLSYFFDLYHALDAQAAAASTLLLTQAQPYVHAAYQRGNPLIASAALWSQPYLDHVAPVVTPLLAPLRDRVQQTNAALRQNRLVGGYVTSVFDKARAALEQVSTYCVAPVAVTAPSQLMDTGGVLGTVEGVKTVDAVKAPEGGVSGDVMVAEDVDSPQSQLMTEELAL